MGAEIDIYEGRFSILSNVLVETGSSTSIDCRMSLHVFQHKLSLFACIRLGDLRNKKMKLK
jgi:hypothetical protein